MSVPFLTKVSAVAFEMSKAACWMHGHDKPIDMAVLRLWAALAAINVVRIVLQAPSPHVHFRRKSQAMGVATCFKGISAQVGACQAN
jgi:hypothetical protein